MENEKHLRAKLFGTFFKIGAFTFGGGYAMIAMLERECVEKKEWITSDELSDVTIVAESTPGPMAINCATYTGYKMAGMLGAIIATLGITIPAFVIMYVISLFFRDLLSYTLVVNVFKGIQVGVSIIIIRAAYKMIKKMMSKMKKKAIPSTMIVLFFATTLILNIFNIHFSSIYLILIAGLLGFVLYKNPQKKEGAKK